MSITLNAIRALHLFSPKNCLKSDFYLFCSDIFCTFAPESTLEGSMSCKKYFVEFSFE